MAGNQGDIRAFLTKQAYIVLIDGGNTGAHLNAFYMVDFLAHLNQGFYRIESLGGCRIQMDNNINICALCHVLNILERSIWVHAEAQPHMRRHKKDSVSSGGLCLCCHLDGFLGVFTVYAGDNGHHIAAFLCTDFYDTLALCSG